MHNQAKYEAVKTLARVRGIKEFSTEQISHIQELSNCDLTAQEILNEVTNAPKHRTEKSIRSIRTHASNLFGSIAKALQPE